ncbi:DUF3955 domain-containing protein [Bathymodiolus thermophilus thioautotrophic gill symbiont]|jgi:hypothetical protein|uniref:DUF3955 domain-containing protein n=1 Tax=Bathymodiolus thermophilus thioautotrophic gill symbiont TaxID=2360 RepID=A0A1J5TWM7_9GAMM|nr:hypothetical protein BGC33_15225 [Bathymodiolus thermophilus thioautotrophic gill symbiont]CAB5497834.1 hypothetical protein THERMOS_741 [Bathymodiolus thermophilus thioautotrophic gill symbiont]
MQKSFKNTILKISLFFLFLAIISMLAQQTLYPQYTDAQGILHETLWVPIGAFSFVLSLFIFVIYLLFSVINFIIKRRSK